jgi:hypothetical protein
MAGWSYVVAAGTPAGSYMTATALWTGGAQARGGLGVRLQLARQSILGTGAPSLLLSVGVHSPRPVIHADEERRLKMLLNGFVQGQYSLVREVARLSRIGG